MSYIPDTRHKEAYKPYGKQTEKLNPYYYKILRGADRSEIDGYDLAVNTVAGIFDNLDVFKNKLAQAGINIDAVDQDKLGHGDPYDAVTGEENEDDYKDAESYTDTELMSFNEETRLALVCKEVIMYWLEMERDQLVTSMLDNMDDEEYRKAYIEEGRDETEL